MDGKTTQSRRRVGRRFSINSVIPYATPKVSKKDINQYKTAKELEDALKELDAKSNRQKKTESKQGAVKIYEDKNCTMLRVDTHNACTIYGQRTRWCITMDDPVYYTQYKMSNVVFYFLLPKQTGKKYAFAVIRDLKNQINNISIFNEKDVEVQEQEVFDIYGDIAYKKMRIDAVKQPKEFLARLSEGDFTITEFDNFVRHIGEKERKMVIDKVPEDKLDYLLMSEFSDIVTVVEKKKFITNFVNKIRSGNFTVEEFDDYVRFVEEVDEDTDEIESFILQMRKENLMSLLNSEFPMVVQLAKKQILMLNLMDGSFSVEEFDESVKSGNKIKIWELMGYVQDTALHKLETSTIPNVVQVAKFSALMSVQEQKFKKYRYDPNAANE